MIRTLKIAVAVAIIAAALLNPATPRIHADNGTDNPPSLPGLASTPQACSSGWTITGYYLPLQSDFDNFDDFLAAAEMQGSGKLDDGTFVNWNGYIVDKPLTASGLPVQDGMVAFDPNYFPFGTTFFYDGKAYLGADTGGAIWGAHLDIFTGYGKDAEQKAYDITRFGQTVCWTLPQ